MRSRAVALAALLFLPPGAAASDGLALSDCYALALRQAEALKARGERIEQAGWRYRQALGNALPRVSLGASQFWQDSGGRSDIGGGSSLTLTRRPEVKVALRQPLFSGFREFAAMAAYKAEGERERLLRERAEKLLFLEVGQAFYLILQLEKELENLETLLGLTRDRVRELGERERLGKTRRSEVLSVDSQVDALEARRKPVERDRALARELLSFLTGRDAREAPLADAVPEEPPLEAEESLMARAERRSDLAALRQEVEIRRARARAAEGLYYPTAGLLSNYYAKRAGSQRDITWDLQVSLELPLTQGGSARAGVREAESGLREAELAVALRAREVRLEVRGALLRLSASREEARILRSAFDKAAESYRLQAGEYRLGLVNNLEVLEAMNAMLARKNDLDRARLQGKLHWLELRAALEDLPAPGPAPGGAGP